MIGGGEILRGVMEKNAVYSNPAFYCIPLNGDDGTANATATQRGFLQLHKDLWFMATALVPTATQSFGFERINRQEFIRLFDPVNNDDFARVPLDMQHTMIGDSTMNNPFILPEYILWEPGALIGVEWLGVNYNLTTEFKFLTLLGIEYSMKGD